MPPIPHDIEQAGKDAAALGAIGTVLYGAWRYAFRHPAQWVWRHTAQAWMERRRRRRASDQRWHDLISDTHKTVVRIDTKVTEQDERLDDISDGLTQNSNLFHALFMDAQEAHATVDASGQWLRVNKAFERMTGWTNDELIGNGWKNLLRGDELEDAESWWARVIHDQRSFATRDAIYTKPDGSEIAVHITLRGVLGRDGQIAQWAVGVIPMETLHGRRSND